MIKFFPFLGGWAMSKKELYNEVLYSGNVYRTGMKPDEYPFYAFAPVVNGVIQYNQARFYVDKNGNFLVQNAAGSKIDLKENQLLVKVDFSNLKLFEAVVDVEGHGDYTDIQSALNAGKKSIFVRKGTYTITSPITILSSGITIKGESWINTIIKVADGAKCHAIVIGDGATTLSNISITDIQIDGNYANQTGGGSLYGIYLYGGSANIITKVQISNCYIYNCSSTGIYLYYANNNIIIENQVISNQFKGIYTYYSNYNTISNNQANNNQDTGIEIGYSNNNIVIGNQASSNSVTGIAISSSLYNIITENQVNSNPEYGIGLEGNSQYNIIIGNQANYNQYWGIFAYYSNHNTISNNQTILNTVGGILLLNSSYNMIIGNKCTGSGTGIGINNSACNNNLVVKNYLTGNTTSLNNAGTGTILAASTTNDNVV